MKTHFFWIRVRKLKYYGFDTDFNPDDHNWEGVNATNFVNETAHQLENFIDRYTIHVSLVPLLGNFVVMISFRFRKVNIISFGFMYGCLWNSQLPSLSTLLARLPNIII